MNYSIGEISEKFGLSIPTLRYYDREGLTPFVERTKSGNRIFQESDVELLKIVQCLKSSGMTIKDIRVFIEWCIAGDDTLQQRYQLFTRQKAEVEKQMEELQDTLNLINYKCEYYKTAVDAGTENIHKEEKIGHSVFE